MTQLRRRLVEQIGHLEVSAARLDAGWPSEANRLAVVVRVLVHQTQSSHSLYDQMGIKSTLKWLSADRDGWRPSVLYKFSMVIVRQTFLEDGVETSIYPVAQSDMLNPAFLLDFDAWWTTPIMAANGVTITRKDVVSMLANQDGGAHVDLMNRRFRKLLAAVPMIGPIVKPDDSAASGTMAFGPVEASPDVARAVLQAAMRTIAEEVWLGYNNQLEIIDPDGEIPRHQGGRIGPEHFTGPPRDQAP